jgi:hypothetical protein
MGIILYGINLFIVNCILFIVYCLLFKIYDLKYKSTLFLPLVEHIPTDYPVKVISVYNHYIKIFGNFEKMHRFPGSTQHSDWEMVQAQSKEVQRE